MRPYEVFGCETVAVHLSTFARICRYTIITSVHREFEMDSRSNMLLSPKELALRWDRSETTISLYAAVGVGPSYVKVGGRVMYALDEIQKYERACLFFDPAEVSMQTVC